MGPDADRSSGCILLINIGPDADKGESCRLKNVGPQRCKNGGVDSVKVSE